MSSVLDGLRGVVHPDILERTESISRMLTALGPQDEADVEALLRDDESRLDEPRWRLERRRSRSFHESP